MYAVGFGGIGQPTVACSPCLLDERAHKFHLQRICQRHFRMPLNADNPRVRVIRVYFDRFNDTVVCPSGCAKAAPRFDDDLPVETVYLIEPCHSDGFSHNAAG